MADTVAHRGQYAAAIALLDVRVAELSPSWLLKREALRALVARTSISQQERTPIQPPVAGTAASQDLWKLDALRPEGWLALSAEAAADQLDWLLDTFLMICAFPHDFEPVPWWELLTVSHELDRQDVLRPATLVASRRLGDDFIVGLEHLRATDESSSVEFAAVLDEYLAVEPEGDPVYTVRVVEPDGTFTVLGDDDE